MKKRTLRALYLIFMSCLILWMFTADALLESIGGRQKVLEISFEDYEQENDAVHYSIDSFQPIGDLLQTVTIRGWAYCETEFDNVDCRTELLLTNGKHSYGLKFKQPDDEFLYDGYILRADVVQAFPKQKIYSSNIGFISDFSMLPIEDGVYDLYCYRWENEHNSGCMPISQQIVKNNMDITLRTWEAIKADIDVSNINESGNVNSSLEWASINNNAICFSGWAFEESHTCETQQIYLKIKGMDLDGLYTTQIKPRKDVAECYENSQYEESGFFSSIHLNSATDENTLTMTVYMENGGALYKGKTYELTIRDEDVEVKEIDDNTDSF